MTAAAQGSVRLTVPPGPRYLSAVRVVAGAMAADAGFSVDDLDDLRLGVDELVSALIAGLDGADVTEARITLDYLIDGSSVVVSGGIEGAEAHAVPDPLTSKILAAVSDHYELGPASFVITKTSSLREQH